MESSSKCYPAKMFCIVQFKGMIYVCNDDMRKESVAVESSLTSLVFDYILIKKGIEKKEMWKQIIKRK
jgi:hypothetical protein